MKIAAVRAFVEDIDTARSFYADTLGLQPTEQSPGHLAFNAGPLLLIEKADAEARAEGLIGRFLGFSLATDDIAALHTRLSAAGCEIVGAPERQSWGGTLMHVKDLSGNVVTFVQSA